MIIRDLDDNSIDDDCVSVTQKEMTNMTTMMMMEVEDMPSHSRLSSS